MADIDNPTNEGHTREWQDRARVVLDAKKEAQTEALDKQSPAPEADFRDGEETNKRIKKDGREKDDRFY
ncbi:MAG TPA: hypothetical protein VM101_01615 [Flavitalea sp.]|nr:hypothetical protein [Flavitalea sp.]